MDHVCSEIDLEVAFYDLDPMNIVWHGNYVKYFELARCAVLDKIDFGYMRMQESGYQWPVIDLQIRFIKPAVMGRSLKCRACIVEYENRLKISYLITCAQTGKRIARGYSVQVAVCMPEEELQLVSPAILFEKMSAFNAKD